MSIISTSLERSGRALVRSRPTWRLVLETVGLWRRRARERAELARLTERELRDIGISAADAQRELDKPFWRP